MQCYLHIAWQCKCQHLSSQRSYLYKQSPAQLVSFSGFPNLFLKSSLASIPYTVLQFSECQIWDGISSPSLLLHCQLHMVSDLSPSQPRSLHNFFPRNLSWVPSATSPCYFLDGRQPSKRKYFRTYASSFPSFASIWYQNLFSMHPSCFWQIFRIIWLSPSTLERFFFSICYSGTGKVLVLCLLNKGIGDNIANRTEDF